MKAGIFPFHKKLSMRAKMALAVSFVFALFFLSASIFALKYFEQRRKTALMDHTFAVVSITANSIDSQLRRVHQTIIKVAAIVPASAITNAATAQAFLDQQAALHSLFDNGLFLISLDGKLIAESPFKPGRRGRDISSREFYQQTIATRHPYISKPYRSTHNPNQPALIMTAPIFNHDGKMIGLIEGSLDLLGADNILTDLAKTRFGLSGYLYLADGRDAMISHPDKSRIMKQSMIQGQNALFDRAIDGFEGSGETVTLYGVPMLTSIKRIPSTGWILGGNYPTEEAYAPINQAKRYFVLVIGFGIVLMLAMAWLLMRWLTAPLLKMTAQVNEISMKLGTRRRVDVNTHDEIGTLAQTFNSYLDVLDNQREEHNHLVAILETTTDLVSTVDPQGNITYLNRGGRILLGLGDQPLSGLLATNVHPPWANELIRTQGSPTAQREGTWHGETAVIGPDGQEISVSQVIISHLDANGKLDYMSTVMRNITERKLAEEQIRNLAYFDSLTNLPNRRLLMDRLGQALIASNRTQEFGALIIMDLDNFKVINDTKGHDAGDRLLIDVAQRLLSNARQEDTVSRLGGDEYMVIMEHLGTDESQAVNKARLIAEKLHHALNQPYALVSDGQAYHGSASIGLTLFRGQTLSAEILLKQADVALYQAKGAGRNAIRFFNPKMQAAIDARSSMESAMRNGLQQGEFQLFYQPQIDQDGYLVGAEALSRWFPANQPLIMPNQFIPLAEDTGLILPLGLWVMQTACAQLEAWEQDPAMHNLQIAINVSARQFHQPNFLEQIRETLDDSYANPALLKLELTESVVLENIDDIIRKMKKIKELGVAFSLDDFGTGFSSLSYLKLLPLDQVKIDRSFIRGVTSDSSDAAIVRAIITMCQSLGMQVIAEGVETQEQLYFLKESGCTRFQGYLFGKPMPVGELSQIIQQAEVNVPNLL
jgi:diguanylate cyclase (GGDEF)-like protein/PAS domain S-box-containing protein